MERMSNECKRRNRILTNNIKNISIFLFVLFIFIFMLSGIQLDNIKQNKILAKNTFWKYANKGIKTAEIKILNNEYATIKLLKIDPKCFHANIMYSRNIGKSSLSVRSMTKHYKNTIGINANYFDENDYPLGHLKIKGKTINNYIAEPLIYSGIITFKNGKMKIIHRNDYIPENYDEALQVGPRLISNGKMTYGIENMIDFKNYSRRSMIGFDKNGSIILGVTYGITSWKEIVDTLLNNSEINIDNLINLDGGSSAQIYASYGEKEIIDERGISVPVGIGFKFNN